jgi:RNA polymerase sigma factor (sigma-70 family)
MEKRDHDAILNAYNLARERITRRKTDLGLAEDALQESIVNVLNARARVKNLPAYAIRTVYREIRRLAKLERRSDQKHTTEEELDSKPDLDWEDRIHRRLLVRELISELEGRDQILVKLYSEDFPWEYIGSVVGLSPKSAKQTCYMLLRRLRQSNKAST